MEHPSVFRNVVDFELEDQFEGDDDFQQDDTLQESVGKQLGSLASSRQKMKQDMFAQIVLFRDNRKNGSRKLAKMK